MSDRLCGGRARPYGGRDLDRISVIDYLAARADEKDRMSSKAADYVAVAPDRGWP
jgi:hypothetical protein